MKLDGNTILVTGGGSGIGRGLAEALHRRGNTVIVAGRRRAALDAVVAANPGIVAVELDIADPASIAEVSKRLIADHPALNVLINNAGIMQMDNAATVADERTSVAQVETNLLGSIRLSGALVEHFKAKPAATIIYNTSVLAYVPLAVFAVYSATKAALHSYAMSQRFMLRDTSVRVQEIAPPWVGGTDLLGMPDLPGEMPLGPFIDQTMAALERDDEEILVETARPYRDNAGPGEHAFVGRFNAQAVASLAKLAG